MFSAPGATGHCSGLPCREGALSPPAARSGQAGAALGARRLLSDQRQHQKVNSQLLSVC